MDAVEDSSNSCRGVAAHLSDYVDGELEPGQRAELEAHIRACPACHARVDTMRDTIEFVHAYGRTRMPQAARRRLMRFFGLDISLEEP